MSATFAPFGFEGRRSETRGAPQIFALKGGIASGYATAIYRGDPIKHVTGGTFQLAAPGDTISGFFHGWLPEDANVFRQGDRWVAGTTWTKPPIVQWIPAKGHIFMAQVNGSVAQTAIGDVMDYVGGTGNTNNGKSGAYLSATLAGAGNSAQFKVIGLVDEPGNAWGDAYTKILVEVNEPNLATVAGNAI